MEKFGAKYFRKKSIQNYLYSETIFMHNFYNINVYSFNLSCKI